MSKLLKLYIIGNWFWINCNELLNLKGTGFRSRSSKSCQIFPTNIVHDYILLFRKQIFSRRFVTSCAILIMTPLLLKLMELFKTQKLDYLKIWKIMFSRTSCFAAPWCSGYQCCTNSFNNA